MNVVERAAGVPAGGSLHEALAVRGRLMALMQASHDAALLPREAGGISHAERAAFALRMARLCRSVPLADHYRELCGAAPAADLGEPGATSNDPRLAAMLAYVDKITISPRDATPEDIAALKAAGIDDGDIVRLAGLVAFVNYQIRAVHVLKLMAEGA